ncbi:RelA/SpoT family protein [Patescibacteria group bacterium]|nr:RelA/SpoT family protein [Patescibacteria group bacterium]MBU2579606.1 RelA/SpoT family protein [Patescibacteria group bacterium]MCG2809327.1 RelA/SpoT family protein [Candidatus Portnoybacteria bacterium]
MADIQQIIEQFKKDNPLEDSDVILRAYHFAAEAHRGQKRKSGDDYITHCLGAAETLVRLRMDSETIAAGLLHDVLDDTKVTPKQMEKEFGANILKLVNGVCKIGKLKYRGEERAAENLRKLFLAMAEDIRVILIKFADRLHNIKTLDALPAEKQKRIALETLEIYAPLADRLGIGEIKGQLEDYSFAFINPKEYQEISSKVKGKYAENIKYLEKTIPLIKKVLSEKGIKVVEIHARAKHYYSLYKKLLKYDMDWHRVYDLVALRVIVPDIESCYATLGIVHKKWRPLFGRIKDYIALPKSNGYKSIHTTIFCDKGKITELQIRTPQMHEEAEYGIAAHWHYKENKGLLKTYIQQKILKQAPKKRAIKMAEELVWVKQLREWQKEKFSSPREFFDSLKIDFLKDRIFVFTPKGDVIDLPEGATSIDFAYQIHTDIGHQCVGVKVDGKLCPLSEPLRNGQMVDVMTQKNKKPSRDWLRFVKTNQAKSSINAWYRKN